MFRNGYGKLILYILFIARTIFLNTINGFVNHQKVQNIPNFINSVNKRYHNDHKIAPSSSSTILLKRLEGEDNIDESENNNNEDLGDSYQDEEEEQKTGTKRIHPSKRTKVQIKTLKFRMNQDVEDLINSRNYTAAILKAEENIQRSIKLYKTTQRDEYKPNIINYNLLLRAYAKSGKVDAPSLAEGILNQMKRMYKETNDIHIKPNIISYTEVIDAYARSNSEKAAATAEKILLQLMEGAEEDNTPDEEKIVPSSITCDAVLNAWAKRRSREGAERAEALLERMEYLRTKGNIPIRPTSFSFATVISAWAKSGLKGGEAAERAEYILERMRSLSEKLMEEGNEEYGEELMPCTVIYNSVIDAWAKSENPRSGTRAVQLLNQMDNELKSKKYGSKCQPDTITYNSVINCIANSGHINAATQAEKILTKMESFMKMNSTIEDASLAQKCIEPNTQTYNQVLKAYAKSKLPNAAERADMILSYMLKTGNKSITPDVYSFSTCLDVWAKSNEPNKAAKAQAVLHKMNDFYNQSGIEEIKPNILTYNTVLNACAFSAYTSDEEKKQAIAIAVSTLKEIQLSKNIQADAVTYGTFLKCCANLIPQGDVRTKISSDIFYRCCNEGMVNNLVFNEIRRAVPTKAIKDILGDKVIKRKALNDLQLSDLPSAWSRNVNRNKGTVIKKNKTKVQKEKKKNVPEDNKSSVNLARPMRPMSSLIETSWQSGRDV